jgi:tetratricopeptide (TPR) repeat protein
VTDNFNAAASCFEQGAFADAERLCRAATGETPQNPEGRVLLGRILQAQKKWEAAQSEYRAVVQSHPTLAAAWLHWADLLQSCAEPAKAIECLKLALSFLPNTFQIHIQQGLIYLALGNLEAADECIAEALRISPDSDVGFCHRAVLRSKQSRLAEAIADYRHAIALNPLLPEAHNNLGDLLKVSEPGAAIEHFETATRLRPNYAEALANLGVMYFLKGDLHGALKKFDEALVVRPDFPRVLAYKANTLFFLGRLREAWPFHKHRFDGFKLRPHGRFSIPEWNGESLKGKALLVWTEQGLGEEILQASIFSDVLSVVSRLTIECSPRLEALFARSFPDALIIPRVNPSRASTAEITADIQIASGDLGATFRNDWRDFPRHAGYLVPDPVLTAACKRRYRKEGKLVVGLSWASHAPHFAKDKSLQLNDFAPVLRFPGAVFVNLQYMASAEEVASVESALGIKIISDGAVELAGDLDDVAAQIGAMDLVISVSNTAVHLAGALNVPVWNIIPGHNASGLWHWFHDTDESPWYPSMKIYRRVLENDRPLMKRISADLESFAKHRGEASGKVC